MDKRYIMPCKFCGATRIDGKCNTGKGHVWPTITWREHFGIK